MALARIISNSQFCSRELALNLLERGYAVEIVSPDAIPDNLADLELRVETGPADILTANVEARGETRSATLNFIHQLKSPSLAEMKRPVAAVVPVIAVPEATISEVTIPALAISAKPLPPIGACAPIPVSTTALASAIMPRIVEQPEVIVVPANPASNAVSDPPKKPPAFSEGASRIVMPSPSPEVTQKVAEPVKADVAISATAVFWFANPKPPLRKLSVPSFRLKRWKRLISVPIGWIGGVTSRMAGWFGWTALSFAGVMALGLALQWSFLPTGRALRDVDSGITTTENGASVDGYSFLLPLLDENENNVGETQIKSSVSSQSFGNSAAPRTAPPVAQKEVGQSSATSRALAPLPAPKTARVAHKSTPVSHDDVVAPDTITYFNQPGAKPVPIKQLAQRRADSRKRGEGVIAANSAPAKSAAQTESGK